MEPVYGTVIQLARLVWRAQGLKFTVTGVENLPRTGGAVVAINHTSYFDFTFAGLPAYKQHLGRKVRFMAKKEVFDNKVTGPIMRSLRHIEVDRDSGADSFEQACRALKEGELVGVYPEATISRSFEIKGFKSGAARMAVAADVPIVPHIVWGAQRIWTKGHPRKMWRPKVPISIAVGEPIMPTLPPTELTALLHSRMQHLLEQVQDAYGPYPPGEFWVPHRLGGGAPTLGEANQMDAEEASQKARAKADAQREPTPPGRRGSGYGAGFPHTGDRSQRGDQGHRDPDHLSRPGKHPGTRRRRDRDQPHELPRLVPGGARGVSAAPPNAVHDQDPRCRT